MDSIIYHAVPIFRVSSLPPRYIYAAYSNNPDYAALVRMKITGGGWRFCASGSATITDATGSRREPQSKQ